MRLGRIATLAMLAIAAVAPAMAQTVTRSGAPYNPPVVPVRRYVTRTVDSLAGHRAGMLDSAVWVSPPTFLPAVVPMGAMYGADTTARIPLADNAGNLYTNDVSRDRDYQCWTPLTSDTINAYCADSSDFVYTGDNGRLLLSIKADIFATTSSSIATVRLAVTIEGSYVRSTASDTSAGLPWYPARNLVASGTMDSLSFGTTQLPTQAVPAAYEMSITLNSGPGVAGTKWAEPSGGIYALVGPFGEPYWMPYTRVKVRVTGLVNCKSAPRITAVLVGRPN